MPVGKVGMAAINTGLGIVGNAANGLLGMIGQRAREERALGHQKELMDVQFQNQKLLDKYGQDIQLDTWEKTNYPAQIAMMKQAGLSPGLMYGKGSAGGATTGSQGGGSAASGSAPNPQPWMMDLGIQNAMKTAAEIALIKAQERKTNVEADKTAGVDTKEAETRIDKLIAETQNEELKGELIKVQTQITNMSVGKLENEISNIAQSTEQLRLQNKITNEAYISIVKEIEQRAIGVELENELTQSKKLLTDAEKKSVITSIMQKWTELGISKQEADATTKNAQTNRYNAKMKLMELQLQDKKLNFDIDYPGMGDVAGSVMKKAYSALEELMYGLDYVLRISSWK